MVIPGCSEITRNFSRAPNDQNHHEWEHQRARVAERCFFRIDRAATHAKEEHAKIENRRADRNDRRSVEHANPDRNRHDAGGTEAALTYGNSTVAPVVWRDSSARCAAAASFRGNVWLGADLIFPDSTSPNNSSAIAVMLARFVVYVTNVGRVA